jgi:hypothetical protein
MRNYSFSSMKKFTKGGKSAMCLSSLYRLTLASNKSSVQFHFQISLESWECWRIKWFSKQIHNLLLPWTYLIADPRSGGIRDTVILSSPSFITEMTHALGVTGNWSQAIDHRLQVSLESGASEDPPLSSSTLVSNESWQFFIEGFVRVFKMFTFLKTF